MKEDVITIPRAEWDNMIKRINDLQKKVETLYSRETDYVSMSELCEWLQISRTTLWRLRSEGKIRTWLIGGKMVANKEEIQRLLNEGKI